MRSTGKYPCPTCGSLCAAHDFKDMLWRHLNVFQHSCFLRARVPRVKCVPSTALIGRMCGFTLLFEEEIIALAWEISVPAIARHIGVTNKCI
ncbi:MAG: transposase family protein [Desulfovibrio piger]|uniref:transposase family protein n=1 Tax=Desulfovibrio piger TaxID=901 RepID=UPI00399B2394